MTAQPTGSVLTEGFTRDEDYFGIAPYKHRKRLINLAAHTSNYTWKQNSLQKIAKINL